MGIVATKAKIAADGDYNLSGERYRDVSDIQEHAAVSDFVQIGRNLRCYFGWGDTHDKGQKIYWEV